MSLNSINHQLHLSFTARPSPGSSSSGGVGNAAAPADGRLVQLAQALGVTTQALDQAFQTAFQQAQSSGGSGQNGSSPDPGSVLKSVAQQLNLDPSKLQNTMQQLRGRGGHGGHHPHGGARLQQQLDQVAQQLGVSSQQVDQAFQSAFQQLSAQNQSPTSAGSQTSQSSADSSSGPFRQLISNVADQLGVGTDVLTSAMQKAGMRMVDQFA